MEEHYTDELYEIMDEFNARVEEMVNYVSDPKAQEILISRINDKMQEFVTEIEQEIEKLELIELSM